MDNVIREFEKIKKYSNLISIGKRASVVYVYKYMSIKTAEKCLYNNSFMFSIPPAWKDPYESRFYNAKYNQVEKYSFDKRLFACCVTENKLSESAWRMYKDEPDEPCVKFCICVGQLRKHLNNFARIHDAMLYEGRVNYSLNDYEIDGLHLRSSKFYPSFFDNFDNKTYLNLMLLKRHLFYYEGEIRYILSGNSLDFSDKYLFVEMPWGMCLSKISMNSDNSDNKERIKKALETNYDTCVRKYSLQYRPYVPIVIEDIYKPFKPITVEK